MTNLWALSLLMAFLAALWCWGVTQIANEESGSKADGPAHEPLAARLHRVTHIHDK